MQKSTVDIERKPLEAVVGKLLADDEHASLTAGRKLLNEAKSYGLTPKQYLDLAVNVPASEHADRFKVQNGQYLSGYEAALSYMNIPIRDDYKNGITVNLASDTFQTFPGSRVVFPEVINDMVQYKYRQDMMESLDAIISQSRTVSGVQEITYVVDDADNPYQHYVPVAEMARIPVKSLRTTEKSVTFYKFGHGLRTSYEFDRRASLDLIVPFLARTRREIEMSKVGLATWYLINGDSVNPAAPVVNQSSLDGRAGTSATAGVISWKHLLLWLMDQYKAGIFIDTLIGNWDTAYQLLTMLNQLSSPNVTTDGDNLNAAGFNINGLPLVGGALRFALSTSAPDGQIIGEARAETIEQLIEAGSIIEESERAIENQTITVYATENSGFKLIYPDTRAIFDYSA